MKSLQFALRVVVDCRIYQVFFLQLQTLNICISLRGNDLTNRSVGEMLNGIAVFKYHLPASWPKQILRYLELFHRGDQTEEPLLSKLKDSKERSKIEFKAEYYPNSPLRANALPDLVIASKLNYL